MRFTIRKLSAAAVSLAIGTAALVATNAGASTTTAGPRQILFVGGEQAVVEAIGGRTEIDPSSPASLSVVLTTGGKTYDVPLDALPYIGRGLDSSLFDVAALVGNEPADRIPVQIRYDETSVPHLPGITITASGAGTASGYLTAASAKEFGTALNRQYLADRSRGGYGTDGLFAGGVSISLAGAARPASPRYVAHTLTVTGTDLSGGPDTGDVVLVFNVDNGDLNNAYDPSQVFDNGVASYSLPSGHYFAIAAFVQMEDDNVTSAHVDVLPQFPVSRDTTVHTSARAASSQLTMVTPRLATAESSDFSVLRTSASGPASQAFISALGAKIWVNPTTAKPTVGMLTSYAAQQLASPPGRGTPYQYELSYVDPSGTIPPQRYRVQPSSLATVTDVFYQDVPASGEWFMYGTAINQYPPGAGYINPYPYPIRLAGRQIRYIGGDAPATTWGEYYHADDAAGNRIGSEYEMMQTVRPGEQTTDTWNQYPLHPGPNVNPDPQSAYDESLPSASREGDTLTVSVTPFEDNDPGHNGPGFTGISDATTTGTYRIEQDGTRVAGGTIPVGPSGSGAFVAQATLSPDPSTVSFELDATQTGSSFPLSTASTTVWTWRSAHESGATLPEGWYCDDATSSSDCAVEPMMTLWYHVQNMALNGTTRPGQQVLDLTAGHIPAARPSAITGARVQVSVDDGLHWSSARVTRIGPGDYRVVYNAPAGAYVTLRTTATDAAGGSIAETTTRGYRVSAR
jgi:hypothetical protein